MAHIVIVDDEVGIADTLGYALQQERFTTEWFALAAPALDYLRSRPADLLVLDVGLPDMSGFDACKALRAFSTIPVLFLSARGSEIDRVLGLEIGGDDYVVKPFSPREVVARVRSILKRSSAVREATNQTGSSPFSVNEAQLQIHYHQCPLQLTRHEFQLLRCLLGQPRRVYSREQLLQALGVAPAAGYERSIDTHVKSLRAKLRAVAPRTEPIETLRGFGYRYNPERA